MGLVTIDHFPAFFLFLKSEAMRAGLLPLLAVGLCLLAADLSAGLPVQLDTFGRNSIRVRVAPAGQAIVDPPLQALLVNSSSPRQGPSGARGGPALVATAQGLTLTNGNLQVAVDNSSGCIVARRLSDGALLLNQTLLRFAAPLTPGTRNGSHSITVAFAGHGPSGAPRACIC